MSTRRLSKRLSLGMVIACGCADQTAPSVAPTPGEATQAASGSVDPAQEGATTSSNEKESGYPEKPGVTGLLYRARKLKEDGKFMDALALTEEVLLDDPVSPAALSLRAALLRIIEKS